MEGHTMQENRQATCEERIAMHQESRIADLRAFVTAAGISDLEDLESENLAELECAVDAEVLHAVDAAIHPDATDETRAALDDFRADDVRERAIERAYEYPLGISTRTIVRLELSTGGPADCIEYEVEPNNVEDMGAGECGWQVSGRVTYHFADWFDHAERVLTGDDEAAAVDYLAMIDPRFA
jgi:hypothetical protein